MQLISCAANAICKEEDIPLQPTDFDGRVFETCTWSRHLESLLFSLNCSIEEVD
jgi:hypothetical protein